MTTFHNRSGKLQVRVQIKGHTTPSKTFISKTHTERWVKQFEVEIK